MKDGCVRVKVRRGGSRPWVRHLLLGLFLISGATGLVYEVAWTRMLVLVLGNSTHAVALILAAFMMGLALGSWVFSCRADDLYRPVYVYGVLEAAIGAYALVFPLLLGMVTDFYVWVTGLHEVLGPGSAASYALKFGLAFVLLVIPAFLMGGTLPVIIRWATDRLEVIGGRVGAFYGANTFGAVLGSFLAGYVLIEHLGVTAPTQIAAFVNLGVAVVAIVLGLLVARSRTGDKRHPRTEEIPEIPDSEISPAGVRLTAIAFFVSGFSALALEVLWMRELVFFLQGFTWAFCAMLTTFLFGLALGAVVLGRIVNGVRRPMAFLSWLFLGIAAASAGAQILVVNMYEIWGTIRDTVITGWGVPYEYALFVGAFCVLLVPTFLMGGVFPAVSRITARGLESVGHSVGWVYALNTVGAVLGSLVAGLVLIPLAGMKMGVFFAILPMLFLSLLLGRGKGLVGRHGLVWLPVSLLVIWVLIGSARAPFIEHSHVFKGSFGSQRKLLAYDEGAICAVSVVEDEVTGFRTLYTDEFAAAATGDHYRYMRMLGHLPMMLAPERKDVLVIAFGTGTTAGSVAVHEGVEHIDVVEISQEVLDVAPFFAVENKGVLERPAPPVIETHVMDGRNFVLTTQRKYDVITLEPLMPYTPAAVYLYTREFYEICRKALKPGGVMCQWIPIHAMTVDDYRMLATSFLDVFPESSSVWFFETTSAIIGRTPETPGQEEVGPIEYTRLAERAEEPAVAEDLAAIGLDDPEAVLSCYVTGGPHMPAFVSRRETVETFVRGDEAHGKDEGSEEDAEEKVCFIGIPAMTDDHPVMEFHPVGYGGLNDFYAENLAVFAQGAKPVIERLDQTGFVSERKMAAIERELEIRHHRFRLFLGARSSEEGWKYLTNIAKSRPPEQRRMLQKEAAEMLVEAVRQYDDMFVIGPELPDPVLERYRDGARYNLYVFTALGHLNIGQRAEAMDLLRKAVALSPPGKTHYAWYLLGKELMAENRIAEADRALSKAIEIHPRDGRYHDALAKCREMAGRVAAAGVEDVRAAVKRVLAGTADAEVLRGIAQARRSIPDLATRIDAELRAVRGVLLDVEGASVERRGQALKLLAVVEPDWLQDALGAVVAEPGQGLALRNAAVREAARRPGHEHLFARLRDGDRETRLLVTTMLGARRVKDAVGPLIDRLEDADREVRMQALVALHAITGRQYGYDPDAPEAERAKAVRAWRAYLENRDD
jgi:spermidine synthase/tetratricopeptide (TPR) repeat protein/MFS family permease